MDFSNAKELLALCQEQNKKISEIMLEREVSLGEADRDAVLARLTGSLEIMKKAAHDPITNPVKSLGGLIGGEGKKITDSAASGNIPVLCGEPLTKAIAYAMAVLEVNGTMGLIVAAPTAGSAGVMPGVLIGTCEHYGFGDEKMLQGLLNGSALGYLLMRNASVSGAEAGCQAEVGAAIIRRHTGAVSVRSKHGHVQPVRYGMRPNCRTGRSTLSEQKCHWCSQRIYMCPAGFIQRTAPHSI